MDNAEFFIHMKIIRQMFKKSKYIRIILLHNPYTESQQIIIDSISRHSKQIIGQLERIPPLINVAKEIERLILSNSEPHSIQKRLQFVVLGQQKSKTDVTKY